MFNYERKKLVPDEEEDQHTVQTHKAFCLKNNFERYYETIEEELYQLSKGYEDINRNMFVFPLRLPSMKSHFSDLEEENEKNNIDVSESHLIYQIFWYFLINQIRQFNPTFILVSYSGRLHIEDSHFVEIMQELTKLSQYKTIYFPNLTAYFASAEDT